MLGRMILISWRSMVRNRRRTLVTAAAIGLGLASLIFTDSLFRGMTEYMTERATETWEGHAQIHRRGFRETGRPGLTVEGPDMVTAILQEDSSVVAYTGRLIAPVSLESSRELRPVSLVGVDRLTDSGVTSLENSMIQGSYFTGDSMEMIIGRRLAEDMELQTGDIAVVTAATAGGGFAGGMFIVAGICSFDSEELDRHTAFVNLRAAGSLLGLPGECNEFAILFDSPAVAEEASSVLQNGFEGTGNIMESWPELQPQIHSVTQMVDISVSVMAFILFGLVLFGIVNSLFMSVYERMYEFGVMKALGTSSSSIVRLVLMEAFWLGLWGAVAGAVLGWGVVEYFAWTGISFGEMEFTGIMLDRPFFPVLDPGRFRAFAFATMLFTVSAGLYPGLHAGGLNPASAIRKSL